MEFELNNSFLSEVLVSNDIREAVASEALTAEMLAQAEVAKRTGTLAASIHAHTEIGGVRGDRWIGVVTMGAQGAAGTADYAASHEYGAGDHPGSTGRHHNRPAHVFDDVLEQLEGL